MLSNPAFPLGLQLGSAVGVDDGGSVAVGVELGPGEVLVDVGASVAVRVALGEGVRVAVGKGVRVAGSEAVRVGV